MLKAELLELIKNGENSKIEFKQEEVKPTERAKEIVAFANSDGGAIFIGVDDNGNVVGAKRKDLEEWIINVCRNNCYPSLIPIFESILVDDKTVAVVTVPKREGIVHRALDGRYYIRVGSTKRDATPEELARLFQYGGIVHHDISPVYNTSISDLDRERLEDYFSKQLNIDLNKHKVSFEQLLENIKVLAKVEGKYFVTISGLLIFGKYPERFLTQAGITAVKFQGTEMDYTMVDKQAITGPLINKYNSNGEVSDEGVIDRAIKFVESHTNNTSTMNGIRRTETPQYPVGPIREGIVNAVSHMNYAITGSKIRLFIFKDRLEIRSPGKLPNTVTIENIKRTAHYTRNPELYKLLAQHGYAEDIGLGIPQKIIQSMLDHNGKGPKLEESGEEFVLTLYC